MQENCEKITMILWTKMKMLRFMKEFKDAENLTNVQEYHKMLTHHNVYASRHSNSVSWEIKS